MTLTKHIFFNVIIIGVELIKCADMRQSYDNASKLVTDVVEANNPNLRPILNQKSPIEVTIEFHLMTFLDVDEVNEMVSFHGWFNVSWHDEVRKWDPASYSNINTMYPDPSKMWLPKLFCMTFVDPNDPFLHGSNIMKLYSDGRTRWYPVGKFRVLCPLDLTIFPLDSQTCKMQIVSSYLSEAIHLKPATSEKKDFKDDSEEWDITSIFMYPEEFRISDETHSDLYVELSLTRYPNYFEYTVLIPVMVTSSLSMVSFFIPENSGERLGFATTILLAMVVFLQLISGTLPNASRSFPVVCEYLLLQCAIAAMVIIVLIMHMRFTRWVKVIKLSQLQNTVRNDAHKKSVNMNMNRNQHMNKDFNANKTTKETNATDDMTEDGVQSDKIQEMSPEDAPNRIPIKPKKANNKNVKTNDLMNAITVFVVFVDHYFDWLFFSIFFSVWLIITFYYYLVKAQLQYKK